MPLEDKNHTANTYERDILETQLFVTLILPSSHVPLSKIPMAVNFTPKYLMAMKMNLKLRKEICFQFRF